MSSSAGWVVMVVVTSAYCGLQRTRLDALALVDALIGLQRTAETAPNRLPKLNTRVRYPSSAPRKTTPMALTASVEQRSEGHP